MTTTKIETISKELRDDIAGRCERFNKWLETIGDGPYKVEVVPADCRVTNDERSALEVYDFVNNPPEKYFGYVKMRTDSRFCKMTTFTGDFLGTVIMGREFKDNFGGTRVSIDVYGINGVKYYGFYAKSSGDYCRIKAYKSSFKEVTSVRG